MTLRYLDLIDDELQFPLIQFSSDSYAITNGLPECRIEAQDNVGYTAPSNLMFLIDLLSCAHLGLDLHFDRMEIVDLSVKTIRLYIEGSWIAERPDLAGMLEKSPDNRELEWLTPV